MAAELRHAETHADRQAVGPAERRAVAACAGLRRGDRDAGVEIELLAERQLQRRVEIILGKRDRSRTPVLRLHRIDPGSCLLLDTELPRLSYDRRAKTFAGEACQTDGGDRDGRSEQMTCTGSGHAASIKSMIEK